MSEIRWQPDPATAAAIYAVADRVLREAVELDEQAVRLRAKANDLQDLASAVSDGRALVYGLHV